jgi:hypothetical protein
MALVPESEAAARIDLQERFELILGSTNVYFQPPENRQIQYPCIIYKRDTADTTFADNNPYRYEQRYQVTYISQNPSDLARMKIAALPTCLFVRHYTVKNLNHDVFTLYF